MASENESGSLADAGEAELADLLAEAWEEKGFQTTTKERGSNLFVFAKRRTENGRVSGAVVWVAARRRVGEPLLRQFRSLAENVGASNAVCVTVGDGDVTDPGVARELGIDHLDSDDLRADPDVNVPEAGTDVDSFVEAGSGRAADSRADRSETGDVWDGQTTAGAVSAGSFDGVWNDVTDGESVGGGADRSVWDGTTRFDGSS